ncbi:MAG TPA: hypothetical protein VEI02_12205 [Planctomycetota bacterium]|nr:hypothetical protein [Planctomycetota bacterium]
MTWWAVATAIAAPAAVVALHHFRRRRRERRVAALFLFPEHAADAAAGRSRAPLVAGASFWCEIVAALALALAVGGATVGLGRKAEAAVVVLDATASMGATVGGSSAWDRALDALDALADGLGPDGLLTVVTVERRPAVVWGPRAAARGAAAALRARTPTSPHADALPAFAVAADVARPGEPVVFLTDRPAPDAPSDVETRAVGRAAANDALLSATRAPIDAGFEEIAVVVGAFGGAPRTSKVRLFRGESARGDVAPEAEAAVVLEPGGAATTTFRVPRDGEAWTAALAGDALAADDVAPTFPEPPRIVRVCNLLPADVSRALRLERAISAAEAATLVGDPALAHLTFATTPGRLVGGRVEVVVAPTDGERSDWVGPFLLQRRHPLLDGVALAGVAWGAGAAPPPGVPLASAGAATLLAEETDAGGVRYRFNLDVERGNLVASPDWPILAGNLVEAARREAPGATTAAVLVGEEATWRRTPGRVPTAIGPDGAPVDLHGGRTVAFTAERAGAYRILEDGVEAGRFAARFADARESDLSGAATATRAAARASTDAADEAPVPSGTFERRLLALIALVALALDWRVLRRGSVA